MKNNFFDNPFKKKAELLDLKNQLETAWYDDEAQQWQGQLGQSPEIISMDVEFEKWFADFYGKKSMKRRYDRDYCFFSSLGDVKGKNVLELGFGNGCLSRFLIRRGANMFSVELSGEYCRFLKRTEERSLPIRSCAEILPLKSKSIDLVTTFVALHHFNLDMAFSEITRVMRDGARGVFMEPLGNSKMLYDIRRVIPVKIKESPGGGALHKNEIHRVLRQYGFKYKIAKFELLTRLERLPLMSRFQDQLRRIDHRLLSGLPGLAHYARTAVIQISN